MKLIYSRVVLSALLMLAAVAAGAGAGRLGHAAPPASLPAAAAYDSGS